jgi:hypothetical protein
VGWPLVVGRGRGIAWNCVAPLEAAVLVLVLILVDTIWGLSSRVCASDLCSGASARALRHWMPSSAAVMTRGACWLL